MYLYHVSTLNKQYCSVDMNLSYKQDYSLVEHLIPYVSSFPLFFDAYNDRRTLLCSQKKGWIKEKLAAESIFEYVRQTKYPNSPSRLVSTYFTDSLQKANDFNIRERDGKGAVFIFDANPDLAYFYDMDIFDEAVKLIQANGMSENTLKTTICLATKYWMTSRNGNTEILYKGRPILKRID